MNFRFMNCMSKILKPVGASVTDSKETGKALSTEFYTTTMEMTKILVLNTVLVLHAEDMLPGISSDSRPQISAGDRKCHSSLAVHSV